MYGYTDVCLSGTPKVGTNRIYFNKTLREYNLYIRIKYL